MSLAERKKKENIAEYVLFMWQMEDLVRAAAFDRDIIRTFVEGYTEDPVQTDIELQWFTELIQTMKREGIEKRGHVSEVQEIMHELALLHHTLMNILKDSRYLRFYKDASPYIGEYLQKAAGSVTNDVETCLTALYGLLVLRLKKASITPETEEAMKAFGQLMALLAAEYRKMKGGEMNIHLN